MTRHADITARFSAMEDPLLCAALAAGNVSLWSYTPATGSMDVRHQCDALSTLIPAHFHGPLSTLAQYVAAEDQSQLAHLHRSCLQKHPKVSCEVRVTDGARQFIWVTFKGQLVDNKEGNPFYVGTISHTTEIKERELRLMVYREALFELTRNPIVVNCTDFSEAASYVIKRVLTTLNVGCASYWYFDMERKSLILCRRYLSTDTPGENVIEGRVSDWPIADMPVRDYPAYFAAITQFHMLVVKDIAKAANISKHHKEHLKRGQVKAMLDVPIMQHGNIWGVVSFADLQMARDWDDDALAFAGSAINLLSLALEVVERSRSESELSRTRTRHRAFAQVSHDSVWSVDLDHPIATSLSPAEQIAMLREAAIISDANTAFAKDYKLKPDQVVGRQWSEFMPELFRGTSLRHWIERDYSLIERELRMRVANQDDHWLSLTLLGVIEDGMLVRIWGARRNITDRKRHQSLLEHLAYKDPLTGLLNRQRLVRMVSEMLDNPSTQSGTLFLLDLNQFKDINDTLGHGAGDDLLRQMRSRFDIALADWSSASVTARLGGDEFGVFVNTVGTPETATQVGESIIRALDEPFDIAGGKFHMSASIGAAIYPAHGRTYSELSIAADEAMYHAKQTGGGVRIFSHNTVVFEHSKLGLLVHLPRAIEKGELELDFQPIIDTLHGRAVRMEALVRWNHPEHGRLSTKDFVHKAEMSDSIRVLTRWVTEQAIIAARDWQKIAPGVGVSINVSPRLLSDASITKHLYDVAARYQVDPHLIDLEITETSLIPNQVQAIEVLEDYRAKGFSVVMDDYGVGFCSLAYLRRLPLRGLKIDRSFVANVMTNVEDAIIVQSTIALAHNLGLTVVAEGVEDEVTLKFLTEHQCDFAQGFAVSPPLDHHNAFLWLHQNAQNAYPNPLQPFQQGGRLTHNKFATAVDMLQTRQQ